MVFKLWVGSVIRTPTILTTFVLCMYIFKELRSSLPECSMLLNHLQEKLNDLLPHTDTRGQHALQSTYSSLNSDFETFKSALNENAAIVGMLNVVDA
jgi:hypothetical protein